MPKDVQPEELQRWKHKYYDSLAENERQEQALGALETLLYRSLGRLALAGYGRSADLDKALDRLREAVRSRATHASIEKLIERAGEIAERVSPAAETPAAPPADPMAALLDVVESLAERPGGRALRARVVKATSAVDAARAVSGWLAEQFESFAQTVDVAETPAPEAGCVALVRHLAGALKHSPACRKTLEALLERQRDPLPRAQAFTLIDRVAGVLDAELSNTTAPASADFHIALRDLVHGLVSLFEGHAGLQSLEATLADAPDFQRQVSALTELAQLVVSLHERVRAERAGIEALLGTLTERLRELEEFVDSAHAGRQASDHAGQALGVAVAREVDELHAEVRGARSIDDLRVTLETRVQHIGQRVSQHLCEERQRNEQSREMLSRLDQRLRDTEAETTRLKRLLDEERARASQDSLTGIWNRGAFDKRLGEEVSRARRSKRPLSLMFLDIDHFKRLNDTFGHQAGDRVLAHVAQIIASSLRAHDFLARYGGEEFVVLMPDTASDAALQVAERVRNAVAETGFRFQGRPVQVTLSAGVADLNEDEEAAALLERSDQALYRAKHEGRNRCINAAA